jgi:hypothetical protein
MRVLGSAMVTGRASVLQSPTLGAHAHAHPCPWVLGGHGWASILCIPYIQLQIGVRLLGCREYTNQEAFRTETNDNEQPFICAIQPRLDVGARYTLHNF